MNNEERCLGIDWGGVRIGLAVGDMETKIATPFGVVKSITEIIDVVKKEKIDIVVVGKPKSIVNPAFPVSEEYGRFVDLLKEKIDIPIVIVDERLSSKAADSLAGTAKTKAERDAVAAMLILQSYLDKKAEYGRDI